MAKSANRAAVRRTPPTTKPPSIICIGHNGGPPLDSADVSLLMLQAQAQPETWYSAAQVKARYQISDATIDRWMAVFSFPRPGKYIGRLRRWRGSELDRWDAWSSQERANKQASVPPPRRKKGAA